MGPMRETDLYPPVKGFLEGQGYEVKGEVAEADVVACRAGDPPVIVELKTGFSLALLQQGVARLSVTDAVYVCVPRRAGRVAQRALAENVRLCRRLGLGVLTVRLSDGLVEVHCDPGPYRPRKSAARKGRLLREFARRAGDPARGGAMRSGLVTAYRQDALRVAAFLAAAGPSKGAVVARETGVARATRIMADDHYGWFERVSPGIYRLTPTGADGLARYGADDAEGAACPAAPMPER
ncbi:DUF2161 family putative PD-(D/E)XK-type phosphodiesterase [Psychromarinibacter sp. C21-152]|uniref:DUF2161 family putative PD-(D/E)XK-type phosphodiesterase n=1 Tax=Psychromarinibacter sediminicola TaxID=3033385 RepID=A0AAE3NVQ7_9RHOB|nr:DUF2161 family putative PD-(D/E)XK-type phosphodiesterase [Psychromarinibacter sediminicola]MDF0601517.1 DUF2161 family putative PD-(D/E)XK-type phosphodiesterase [Psychromarinibacter sediminicola]